MIISNWCINRNHLCASVSVFLTLVGQIDPFGHSGAQASLLTGLSGYHGIYFARIDYQDKEHRANNSELELIWRGSASLGKGTQAFTGVLYYHYCPPPGLCFDQACNDATPIQDDEKLFGVNVDYIVDTFVEDAEKQASHYHGDIMFTMGCDFQYEQGKSYRKMSLMLEGKIMCTLPLLCGYQPMSGTRTWIN